MRALVDLRAGNPSSRWLHAQKCLLLMHTFCCLLHDGHAFIALMPRNLHVQGAAPRLRADWPRALPCHKRSLLSSSPPPASIFLPNFIHEPHVSNTREAQALEALTPSPSPGFPSTAESRHCSSHRRSSNFSFNAFCYLDRKSVV